MIITVLPFINFCKACCILYSFSGSAKAVASSNTKIGEFRKIALAIQIRCYGQDALQATNILLKMSGKKVEKEFEVKDTKKTENKTEKK